MPSNYPPGTWEGDPRAPWNQGPESCPDPDCRDDMEWLDNEEVWFCPSCQKKYEEGQEVEPDAEDIAHMKAEQSEEWQRRGGGGL